MIFFCNLTYSVNKWSFLCKQIFKNAVYYKFIYEGCIFVVIDD